MSESAHIDAVATLIHDGAIDAAAEATKRDVACMLKDAIYLLRQNVDRSSKDSAIQSSAPGPAVHDANLKRNRCATRSNAGAVPDCDTSEVWGDVSLRTAQAGATEAGQLLWTELHSGVRWDRAATSARAGYGVSALVTASCRLLQGEALSALEAVDMGLILAGSACPAIEDALHRLAEACVAKREQDRDKKVDDARNDKDEQEGNCEKTGRGNDGRMRAKKRRRVGCDHHRFVQCSHRSDLGAPRRAIKGWGNAGSVQSIDRPSLEWFYNNCIKDAQPAVLGGCMAHWPALADEERRWCNLDRLRRLAGDRTVPVEVGKSYMSEDFAQALMPFSQVLSMFDTKPIAAAGEEAPPRIYLAQYPLLDQIRALREDVREPDYTAMVDGEVRICNLWVGSHETISPLHHDPHHNLLCQVVGRKYVRLYNKEQSPLLYPHGGISANTSRVDVVDPDLGRFPAFARARGVECVLYPGQMLYIPPGCWHFVAAMDASISVSFWFGSDRLKGWTHASDMQRPDDE